jgi:cell division protein ZapA
MPTVEVKIGNRDYKLVCGAGQEDRLRRLALQISEKIDKMHKTIPASSEMIAVVMSFIKTQDELNEAYSEIRKLKQLQTNGQFDLLDSQKELESLRVEKTDFEKISFRVDSIRKKLMQLLPANEQ